MSLFDVCVCVDMLLLLLQNLDYRGFCDQYLFKAKKIWEKYRLLYGV